MAISDTRQQAHDLVDRLPPAQLSALVGLLETILDPVSAALRDAPPDDEEETDAEKRAVQQARDWLTANGGKGIPHEKAMRRLSIRALPAASSRPLSVRQVRRRSFGRGPPKATKTHWYSPFQISSSRSWRPIATAAR